MKISSIGFTGWVIIGAILGIFAGVFLGDYCKILSPIGSAYVMLLQVALYPFLICSLVHGLGKLSSCTFIKLFKGGWIFYILAWGITLGAIFY
jgi:Na+/H+-dicarboxylate symporter